jgi:uncharacterized protein
MAAANGFSEIVVCDIQPGEQITGDYGSLNIDVSFECACGYAQCRGVVGSGDFERYSGHWDALVGAAFPAIGTMEQPLWDLVQDQASIGSILAGESRIPRCRIHSFGAVHGWR